MMRQIDVIKIWQKVITQSDDTNIWHKALAHLITQTNVTERDDKKWWHKAINISDHTKWWPKLISKNDEKITQSDDTKW